MNSRYVIFCHCGFFCHFQLFVRTHKCIILTICPKQTFSQTYYLLCVVRYDWTVEKGGSQLKMFYNKHKGGV